MKYYSKLFQVETVLPLLLENDCIKHSKRLNNKDNE